MVESYLHSEIKKQSERWDELDTLLSIASCYEPENKEYISTCRSAAVLLCAHFEGSLKVLSKAVIADVLDEYDFSCLPDEMQMRYVGHILLSDPSTNEKMKRNIVDKLSCAKFQPNESDLCSIFDHDSHVVKKVLEKWAKYFGLRYFFAKLQKSKLEEAFTGNIDELQLMLNKLKTSCLKGSVSFPYKFAFLHNKNWHIPETSEEEKQESLYAPLLEHAFQQRHQVAHGASVGLGSNIKSLKEDSLKLQILSIGYAALIGESVCANIEKKT